MVYVSFCCLSRHRPRNTRIQGVQAKRKALDLDLDGKCCPLRTRKGSLAYRQAVEAWIVGRRADIPRAREFEHKPARVRRKEAKWQMRWKPINMSDEEKAFMDSVASDEQIAQVFVIPPGLIGETCNG